MKYGRSLSLCIADICKGIVKENEVDLIVTSTCARDNQEFEELINGYCESYWSEFPAKARKIAWRLWKNNQIKQPRLSRDNLFQSLYRNSIRR